MESLPNKASNDLITDRQTVLNCETACDRSSNVADLKT